MLKIIFMGTPEFSVPVLDALNKTYEVVGVVTQPDKPVGRHMVLTPSPVKTYALEHNLKIFQPEKLKDAYDELIALQADLLVTAAYGQFVGTKLLEAPKFGAINCHGSLLPKYRGGSPVQTAIKNGEKETGISIMYMIKQMDAGDVLSVKKIPILDSDTGESMFQKLSIVARDLLMETIPLLIEGKITPTKQDESQVSFAYNITKEEQELDFNKSSREVFNHVRAYYPSPATYFMIGEDMIKIYQTSLTTLSNQGEVGKLFVANKNHLYVNCGDGCALEILELKPAGKGLMKASDFINGVGRKYLSK